jgi:hypothetical protein
MRNYTRQIEPGLGTLESAGSRIIGISSPYRKSGLLYRKFKESFGQPDDDVLVIQAPTRVLNPTFSQAIVDRATPKIGRPLLPSTARSSATASAGI